MKNNNYQWKKLIHTIIAIALIVSLIDVTPTLSSSDTTGKNTKIKESKRPKPSKKTKPKINKGPTPSKKTNQKVEDIPGRWRKSRTRFRKKPPTPKQDQDELIKQLESLGYVSGSRPAPELKGVTIYNKNLACNGLNLLVSGHKPEAVLMDMEGNELHKWSYDFWRVWPDFKPAKNQETHEFWRRALVLENGDLLAIFDGIGLIKLDKDSNLLWAFRGKAHHDLFVCEDGKIYVLTRKAGINRKYNKRKPILEDFVTILSPNGSEIKHVSILKSLENSFYSPILKNMKKKKGDIFHTNTIEVLDGRLAHRSPAFRKGNVLICIRELDVVCVIDPKIESVVWALSGLWSRQHESTILENGNILIFDNRGHNDKSRIIEFDPFSQEVFWTYTGTTKNPFFSSECGSCQRLPNGNTLISETDAGRAFEVKTDKTIVWEFFNPHRAGANKELIASLFEIIRLKPDFSADWMDKKSDNNY